MAKTVRHDQQRVSAPKDDAQNALVQERKPEDLHRKRLIEADRLAEAGELDDAWAIVDRHLTYISPDTPRALVVAQKIYFKMRKMSVAYQFARRLADVDPRNSYAWSNLGMLEEQLYRFDNAERYFRKAEQLATDSESLYPIYLNWGCMLVSSGRWDDAEVMARKALSLNPDSAKAKANLGLALLAKGEWKEGWPLYDAIIGFDKSRRKNQYAGEPVWDGSKDKRIVIYGEQGLGDEISFSSMIPDAIKVSKSVVIDCTDKLAGLFRRSFPEAKVYGTRWERGLGWDKQDQEIDASVSVGGLGKLFRPDPKACPGKPWLVPDPDRVDMWKALFAKQEKTVIGVAWSGGVAWTGDRNRKFDLEELLPIFKSVDAVWVSLEYKDASREIEAFRTKHPEVDLRQYPFGTLTQDYDDTAAMVAALDHVVSMQTSVIHLCGAIGKSCYCFVNKHGQWRYGTTEDRIPWYGDAVHLYRNVNGWPIEQAAKDLGVKFATAA